MEWPLVLLIMFSSLVSLMLIGMPIAFTFILSSVIGAYLFWGGLIGLNQLAMSFFSSVTSFTFLAIPLFILMGNIVFESGVGKDVVEAIDRLIGRIPGRLSLLAIGTGTLLGTMIGISGSTIAILGRSLLPEMFKRGYKKEISIGPIIASGALATMIPPSAAAVLLGAIAGVSTGKLLIAIILPGLLIAFSCSVYIILSSILRPQIAPAYEVDHIPWKEKIKILIFNILPLSIIVFAVIGVIFLGVATPTEAAAFGAMACFLLAAMHRKLDWQVVKNSALGTTQITGMILMIVIGSICFSRLLASSGAISGLVKWVTALDISPMAIVILTQLVVLFLGFFMDLASIIMITVPIFVPLVSSLGFDAIWYAVILLLNTQIGLITPPLGLDCYTMKAVAPSGVTLEDVFRSSVPYLIIMILILVLIMIFPQITLWLPALMQT